MKSTVFLCKRSIEITIKDLSRNKEKQEEAAEDKLEGEAICDDEEVVEVDIDSDEDDDEDYDFNQDNGLSDLYESRLEPIDDILYFRDTLNTLQTTNVQVYNYVLSCMDQSE